MGVLSVPADFDERNIDFDIPMNNIADVCHNITIEEDNRFEDTEFAEVNLISTSLQICPTNSSARIRIADSTRKSEEFLTVLF